jgi:hypothetical protein
MRRSILERAERMIARDGRRATRIKAIGVGAEAGSRLLAEVV